MPKPQVSSLPLLRLLFSFLLRAKLMLLCILCCLVVVWFVGVATANGVADAALTTRVTNAETAGNFAFPLTSSCCLALLMGICLLLATANGVADAALALRVTN